MCCVPFDLTLFGHGSMLVCVVFVLWRIPIGRPSKVADTLPKDSKRGLIAATVGGHMTWKRLGEARPTPSGHV